MLSSALIFALAGAHVIQPPGSFHEGEAVARHGERWLALRVRGGDAQLEMTRLRVKPVFDVVVDAEGDTTGSEVASDDDTDVLTYLRGPGLHAGKVVQAQIEGQGTLAPNESGLLAQTLQMGGRRYRIDTDCRAENPRAAEPGVLFFDCSIQLIDGERTQTLMRMSGTRSEGSTDGRMMLGDDATPALMFAGDLDRDGKLDLIINTTDHYNLTRPVLFLSGAAEGDELLHAVAEHRAVGC
jgi:hypothetical protein